MSNSSYREIFQKIKKVKESNISLMNAMIHCATTFTGKIGKFLDHLEKVSNELPTKKPKKKSMFFNRESEDKYEVFDKEFTPTWLSITSRFVNKPQGIQELNDFMRKYFVEKLKSVVESYTESSLIIESTFQNALKTFDNDKEKYSKAAQNYNSLIARIEQLNDKLKPENTNGKNPEYIEKLKSQLSDAKDEIPSAEALVAETTEVFNSTNLTFSITAENMLSKFEQVDKEHEKHLREVFTEFFENYPKLAEIQVAAADEIKRTADPNNSPQQPPNTTVGSPEDIKVVPSFPMPSFDISAFIDPSEIFNTELVQKLATVVSNDIPFFPQGSLVVVTSESSKDFTIADVVSMKSAVVKKTDIQIEKQSRTIAQLKEDFSVQNADYHFEWKANEFLLVTPHKSLTGQTVLCTDMYGRSGEVPYNKLNTK